MPIVSPAAPCSIVVVGDIMLDQYLWGTCERISPEAPVQVVNVSRETITLGGAANVVSNLIALGARAKLLGVVGDDASAAMVRSELTAHGVDVSSLITNPRRPTTIKQRVMAGAQQIVRVDHEVIGPIASSAEDALLAHAFESLAECDVMVLSDYGKGVLSMRVTAAIIQRCRRLGVPVLVDPKGRDYEKYRGATMITPNRKEAAAAIGRPLNSEIAVAEAGGALRRAFELDACLITLSEDGMALFERDCATLLPTEAREVYDVTGAGDTVVAAIAVALGSGLSFIEACQFANAAAGVVVGKIGSATVTLPEIERAQSRQDGARGKIVDAEGLAYRLAELRETGKRIVFTNGCFDILHAGHVRYLAQAALLGDILVVGLNDDDSVHRLKGSKRPVNTLEDRALVLASLFPVSFVASFSGDTPLELIRSLQPDVLVKGGDYHPDSIVGADIVRARGGYVTVLPFLEGRSTSRIIAHAAGAAE